MFVIKLIDRAAFVQHNKRVVIAHVRPALHAKHHRHVRGCADLIQGAARHVQRPWDRGLGPDHQIGGGAFVLRRSGSVVELAGEIEFKGIGVPLIALRGIGLHQTDHVLGQHRGRRLRGQQQQQHRRQGQRPLPQPQAQRAAQQQDRGDGEKPEVQRIGADPSKPLPGHHTDERLRRHGPWKAGENIGAQQFHRRPSQRQPTLRRDPAGEAKSHPPEQRHASGQQDQRERCHPPMPRHIDHEGRDDPLQRM